MIKLNASGVTLKVCTTCNEPFNYDGLYCYDCLTSLSSMCERCGNTITILSSTSNGICETCNNLSFCSCGNTKHVDSVKCEPCEIEVIKHYRYKKTPIFYGKDSMYMGIELETENVNLPHDVVVKVASQIERKILPNMVVMKRDGSIGDVGNNAFEIVFEPMTFTYLKKEIKPQLEDMFKYLNSKGFVSFNTLSCGMHIHVNRTYFTDISLYKLSQFFLNNSKFITFVSQRNTENLNRWSKVSNIVNLERGLIKTIKERATPSRYSALNLTTNTVEFRIFRGCNTIQQFYKNIEFIHALCTFITNENFETCTVDNFKEFVKKNNRYKNLNNFFEDPTKANEIFGEDWKPVVNITDDEEEEKVCKKYSKVVYKKPQLTKAKKISRRNRERGFIAKGTGIFTKTNKLVKSRNKPTVSDIFKRVCSEEINIEAEFFKSGFENPPYNGGFSRQVFPGVSFSSAIIDGFRQYFIEDNNTINTIS